MEFHGTPATSHLLHVQLSAAVLGGSHLWRAMFACTRSRLESRSPVQNNGSPQTPSDAEIAMENKYKARFDFAQRQWEAKTRALQKELADVPSSPAEASIISKGAFS